MNIISNAFAQSSSPVDSGMSMLIMVGLFFVIMYFMILRPQNKRVKEQNKLISSLSIGSEVIISGGIMGKIIKIKDDIVELEVSSGINVKVKKNSVTTVLPKGSL